MIVLVISLYYYTLPLLNTLFLLFTLLLFSASLQPLFPTEYTPIKLLQHSKLQYGDNSPPVVGGSGTLVWLPSWERSWSRVMMPIKANYGVHTIHTIHTIHTVLYIQEVA